MWSCSVGAVDDGGQRFINRELSWLEFNERVLNLAVDPATPPLERAKYLAIFSQNLDEFFQVRVAGLLDRVDAGVLDRSPDGLTAGEQLVHIGRRVRLLSRRADKLYLNEVAPQLASLGVCIVSWADLDDADRAHLHAEFAQRIFPVLTPLAVDPGHPFPYISNLSLNLAVQVSDPVEGETRFARVKVPQVLPRFVALPDAERFIPLEQLIAAHLGALFHGMTIAHRVAFRVTRNADLALEETEAEDLLAAVEMEVRRRRFGKAVRLQVHADMSDEVLELLQRELDVDDQHTHRHDAPLDLSGLWSIYAIDRPDLKFPQLPRITPRALARPAEEEVDVFSVLRRRDLLVQHPYESFSESTDTFIRQASEDPQVQAIKLTLYRTSGDSPIIASLIRAAEAGKQVVALVELKARFDEANNIEWARRLERAGVHVVYGLVGLKTHTKVVLVARAEGDGVRCYCHIGTGNYNERTARLYEDCAVFTSAEDVATDVQRLFNVLTGYSREAGYRRLLVAPEHLRSGFIELIRGERAAPPGTGAIIMKMNSLADPALIDELYAASSDGVRIQLIVRGICCLRPGVPGLSEHITVRSIVGRYLEHSRVFRFANGSGPGRPLTYLGSADLMPRNLDRRVEALVAVADPASQRRLDEILRITLDDDVRAWELHNDVWERVAERGEREAQVELHELARTWWAEPAPTR